MQNDSVGHDTDEGENQGSMRVGANHPPDADAAGVPRHKIAALRVRM